MGSRGIASAPRKLSALPLEVPLLSILNPLRSACCVLAAGSEVITESGKLPNLANVSWWAALSDGLRLVLPWQDSLLCEHESQVRHLFLAE